jgi:hypothetical protein
MSWFIDEDTNEVHRDDAAAVFVDDAAAGAYVRRLQDVERCIHPDCVLSTRTRGLCHGHYQSMRRYVRTGQATEAKLEARGLLLPKGVGGNKCTGHELFKCE